MKLANNYFISIVLPTYNGEQYLKESIDSCLNQTFKNIELIIVVDGSTDSTKNILSKYADSRIKVIYKENQGLPAALNTGFDSATGDFLTWTSDDNIYNENALEIMHNELVCNKNIAMTFSDIEIINCSGQIKYVANNLWACFLYRATAASKVGNYRVEYSLVEDVDFFLRMKHYFGEPKRIEQVLYKYRSHDDSLSGKYISKRQLVSLKMHYDLWINGMENLDINELILDRMSRAMLHKDFLILNDICEFVIEKNLVSEEIIIKFKKYISSYLGRILNRIEIALSGKLKVLPFAHLFEVQLKQYKQRQFKL